MDKLRRFVDSRLGGDSTDARWGFFSFSFSLAWALLAFALAFFTIPKGGSLMFTSGWMVASTIFGAFGFILLIISIAIGIRWWLHPLADKTQIELVGMRKDIQTMAKEIHELIEELRKHF